jgi:phosphatidylserine/phosphatidylglycerophosphate/cardiolipin synthase-like enzyme
MGNQGKQFPWFDAFLDRALDDGWISREEKRELGELLEDHSPDERRVTQLRAALFDSIIDDVDDEDTQGLIRALEVAVKAIARYDGKRADKAHSESLFFPSRDSLHRLLAILREAERSMDICLFTITDNRVVEVIESALSRGVKVRILSDNDKAEDRGSDIDRLRKLGAPVRLDRSEHHMHHKFAVLDNQTLLTGSYNWTRSAADKNRENILVTTDLDAVRAYAREFDKIWSQLG